jgi:hypothetical protein
VGPHGELQVDQDDVYHEYTTADADDDGDELRDAVRDLDDEGDTVMDALGDSDTEAVTVGVAVALELKECDDVIDFVRDDDADSDEDSEMLADSDADTVADRVIEGDSVGDGESDEDSEMLADNDGVTLTEPERVADGDVVGDTDALTDGHTDAEVVGGNSKMQLPVNDEGNSAPSAGVTTPVNRLSVNENRAPALLPQTPAQTMSYKESGTTASTCHCN